MKAKPITPYQRLLDAMRKAWRGVEFPHEAIMWRYPADGLNNNWRLGELAERVRAAEQLGYDVILRWNDREGVKGLEVVYRKKMPSKPWEIQ